MKWHKTRKRPLCISFELDMFVNPKFQVKFCVDLIGNLYALIDKEHSSELGSQLYIPQHFSTECERKWAQFPCSFAILRNHLECKTSYVCVLLQQLAFTELCHKYRSRDDRDLAAIFINLNVVARESWIENIGQIILNNIRPKTTHFVRNSQIPGLIPGLFREASRRKTYLNTY